MCARNDRVCARIYETTEVRMCVHASERKMCRKFVCVRAREGKILTKITLRGSGNESGSGSRSGSACSHMYSHIFLCVINAWMLSLLREIHIPVLVFLSVSTSSTLHLAIRTMCVCVYTIVIARASFGA